MIVYYKKQGKIMIMLPMGAKARMIIEKLREKGLDFEAKPIYCG